MSADDADLHDGYDRGIEAAGSRLGESHPLMIDGEPRPGGGEHEERSPIDDDVVLGRFAQATEEDVADAVDAARSFAPTWAATPWQERARLLRDAADVISDRRFELAALMTMEVGKNRLEALGDVEESADLIRYYCHEIEDHDGYTKPMNRLSPEEATWDVMRPYGVWAVISPFNFPMALAAGPAGAALVAGNTVVLKPSNAGALMAVKLYEALREAGVPAGAVHLVTGSGPIAATPWCTTPRSMGSPSPARMRWGWGSTAASPPSYPKPAICEMGGKNPVIVTAAADIDEATDGVMRSAFGFGGQKCSAASRVYVERPVVDEFIDGLIAKAEKVAVGDPLDRSVYLGPVIDRRAVERFPRR